MIELTDVNSLKKENITMEVNKKELNEISQKAIELKNKIESEINNINKLYVETIDKLTKSFKIKHEKLLKEENDLKENLENKVNKKKEELEKNLSILNSQIKNGERIQKGIIKMEEEKEKEENNMLKVLSYISNISKFMKKMKELFSQPKQSLKFHFIEEENIIKYEEYYFSGILPPKIVKYNSYASSVDIYWTFENIELNSNNNINFKVEIRKENEDYKKVYEGTNSNCEVNNLSMNTNYEFRICSSINNITGIWTEPYKIKTDEIDSTILNNSKRKNEFSLKLLEWSGYKKMKLLFRGTRDGMNAQSFHNKCDNNGETITLIQNDKGNIFGGYASIPWTNNSGSYFSAPDSFIFTLTNIHNTEPTKFINKKDGHEVCHNRFYGPLFGSECDIYISEDFIKGETKSTFPSSYIDALGKGKSIFTGDANNSNNKFKIKEIEVFRLIK